MSKKRYFDTKFWSDGWVVDELNPLDRYMFMYLILNEKTNIAGVYELPLRTMANELGLDKEEVTRMLKRLEPKVYYRDGWIVLTNGIRHQNYNNSKIKEGIRRELCHAPAHLLELVNFPADLDIDLSCHIDETSPKKDDSYMTHEDPPTLNRIESNRIESNIDLIESDASVQQSRTKAKSTLERIPTEDITELLDYWELKLDMKLGNENGNRKAVAALLRQHGKGSLKRLVDGVVLSQEDQYAPRISDFISLKRKQNDLLVWGRKRTKQTSKVVDV